MWSVDAFRPVTGQIRAPALDGNPKDVGRARDRLVAGGRSKGD